MGLGVCPVEPRGLLDRRGAGRTIIAVTGLLGLAGLAAGAGVRPQFGPENAAMGVLDRFLDAFNARDAAALCRTWHYPHVRFTGGEVETWETPRDCVARHDFVAFAAETGRDRSGWDRRTVVQAYPDKVHVAVIFSEYDAAGRRLAQIDALYIVTRVDGRWGLRARSRFAAVQPEAPPQSGE
jgi:hypothetical protein